MSGVIERLGLIPPAEVRPLPAASVDYSREAVEQRRTAAAQGAQKNSKMLSSNAEHLRGVVSTFEPEVLLTRGSDLEPKPVDWLWPDWLPRSKFCVLAGAAGVGKTTLMIALAATVTIGGRLPDGSRCVAGNVVIFSAEDDAEDTLLPRFLAAGGDPDRVFFVVATRTDELRQTPFDPATDMVQLVAAIEKIGDVSLVLIDPVVGAVTGDSHKNTEVRRGLQPLVDLASYTSACVLGISHFSKGGQGGDPTQRVIGSVAFSAVARVVLVAAKVKGDDGEARRIFARSKSNLGPDEGGFEYVLEQTEALPGIQASRVLWGKSLAGSARELLAEPDSADGEAGPRESATQFLKDLLAGGPVPAKAVKADALEAGHAWATVRRAADAIGVLRRKGGMDAGWYWSIVLEGAQPTSKVLSDHVEQHGPELSTLGDSNRDTEDF